MDKITILLQDKQTIEKLAADPDVQIRIKDAVLDGVAKRYVKTSNVVKDLLDNARAEMRKELFTGTYGYTLKDEYKDIIRKQARHVFNEIINEELVRYGNEMQKEIHSWKADALKCIKERDIEKDIREVAEKVIRDKFKQ